MQTVHLGGHANAQPDSKVHPSARIKGHYQFTGDFPYPGTECRLFSRPGSCLPKRLCEVPWSLFLCICSCGHFQNTSSVRTLWKGPLRICSGATTKGGPTSQQHRWMECCCWLRPRRGACCGSAASCGCAAGPWLCPCHLPQAPLPPTSAARCTCHNHWGALSAPLKPTTAASLIAPHNNKINNNFKNVYEN